jgi:hypothetical protein
MKFPWFGRKSTHPSALSWYRAWTSDGLTVVRDPQRLAASVAATAQLLDAPDLPGLLEQLEDEGFALPVEDGFLIPWDQIYALQAHSGFASSLPLLELPPATGASPVLESHQSLADPHFAITVNRWHDGSGRTLPIKHLHGAVIETAKGPGLLSQAVWTTLQHINAFQHRAETDRTDLFHRRQWGIIRQAALAANARLDDFLYRTVVITPEKLTIGLRHTEVGGTRVVEVSPGFTGAPENWLEAFDNRRDVPNRYDFPTPEGILQVLVTPEVQTVLRQIKRLDRRRVAGSRAEAFAVNPLLRWARTPPTSSILNNSSGNVNAPVWYSTVSLRTSNRMPWVILNRSGYASRPHSRPILPRVKSAGSATITNWKRLSTPSSAHCINSAKSAPGVALSSSYGAIHPVRSSGYAPPWRNGRSPRFW